MTRDAIRITFDRTEFPVPAGTIKARGLEAHRIDIGVGRAEIPRLALDRLDQLRSKTLAAKPLLQPEKLDEQHRGPDFADNASGDRISVTKRDGKPLVFLPAHFLGVVTDQTVEHRLLRLADRALDRDLWHELAQRHIDGGFRKLRVEAALIEFGNQGPLQLVALVEESDAEGKTDVAEDFGVLRPGNHGARTHHGRQIAIGESVTGEIGKPDHLVDDVAA